MNRKVKVNFLFRFFHFVITIWKVSHVIKVIVHNFFTNFIFINVNNVMVFFFVCNEFSITGVSCKFHSFGYQCFVFISITIQTRLGNLCHKSIKGSIRYIFDNGVNVCDDKSGTKYDFNKGVESLIFLPK